MIEVFKIIHNYYDSGVAVELPLNNKAATRGNTFKLENYSFHYDLRKYSLCPRIVNMWYSLPDYVVNTNNLDKFKMHTDKFWQVLFNYKSELPGTGN